MVAEGLRGLRRNLIAAGLIVVFVGLIVWVALELWSVRQRLSAAESNSRILAQQVRDLGGTPRVTPEPGPTGPAGSPGPSGQPGAPGSPGQNGRNGTNGLTGSTGPAGPKGTQGAQGSPGPAGANGPQGATGPAGPKGDPGATGSPGPTGPPPSSWSWTYLGVTYTCTQDSPGSTTYTCSPSGTNPPAARRKKG